jgi:hypothetical protein
MIVPALAQQDDGRQDQATAQMRGDLGGFRSHAIPSSRARQIANNYIVVLDQDVRRRCDDFGVAAADADQVILSITTGRSSTSTPMRSGLLGGDE